ncbi:MAG: hypothetical protein J0G32_02890 [Alphaproteobacteria bacterium]|nr:hypothetical protein [Alphaproteobacteria bacterium]OJV15328.1 MAG: hypothetical protein BGO27_02335 [Alphaproteobacteria bacterium 33-17]
MSAIKNRVKQVEKTLKSVKSNKFVVITYPYGSDPNKAKENYLKTNPHDKDTKHFVMVADFSNINS